MATATRPRTTFICATCHLTTDDRLAVDYKPHRGAPIRICAMCDNVLIGYGEDAGMAAIRDVVQNRERHMVQAGMLSVLAPGGRRIDLSADDLRALRDMQAEG